MAARRRRERPNLRKSLRLSPTMPAGESEFGDADMAATL
jgi:hypothetical protein